MPYRKSSPVSEPSAMNGPPLAGFMGILSLVFWCLASATCLSAFAGSVFLPLDQSRLDRRQIEKAQRVAGELLANWAEGRFRQLSDDFSLEMIARLPPDDQRKAADSLRGLFGNFQAMSFAEAMISPTIPGCVMYRFRGSFSATEAKPEIRVLMNSEGRVVGFWVRHWMDDPE